MAPLKRILIADDHPLIRRGLRALLETRPDLEVVAVAATGREALAAARRSPPDIAIIDYSLPELNGYGLSLQLRKVAPQVHILIYTLLDDEQTIRDALQAGVSGYILKSDTESDLFAAIDSVANGNIYFSAGIASLCWQNLRKASGGRAGGLTPREQEIVQLVAEGRLNKQIAGLLAVSIKTVESHRAAVMRKLGLHTAAQLVRYALRNNIVTN